MKNKSMIDKNTAHKIAKAIHQLKPEWQIQSTATWIQKHFQTFDPRIVAAALTWAALSHDSKTPGIITTSPGDWLIDQSPLTSHIPIPTTQTATGSAKDAGAQQYALQGTSGRMPCHPHGHPDHQTCPECARDRAKARARRERGPQPGQNWRTLAAKHGWHPGMKDKPHKHIQKPTEPAPESTQTTNPTPTHPP